MTYELTWTWGSAAAGCHAALEEIGSDYTLRFTDLEQPWSAADIALNPHRKLPTLIDHGSLGAGGGHPLVLYQAAAILNHLADRHPDANLAPPAGSAERAVCHQWMFFMAEMLQPSMMMVYYPSRYTAGEAVGAVERGREWTNEVWGRLDRAIANGPWFLGDNFSICDLYMLTMAMWNLRGDEFIPLKRHANVSQLVERIQQRPAVARMIDAHYSDD